jgi:hypothetical protein
LKLVEQIAGWFTVPVLTRTRIWFAFTVALLTDGLQLMLGPLGWLLVDEVLDVVAMVLTCGTLGFHILLLPTFIIKSIPVADMLPTWTGCAAAVVMLRKRSQSQPPPLSTKLLTVVPPAPAGQLAAGEPQPVPPGQGGAAQ